MKERERIHKRQVLPEAQRKQMILDAALRVFAANGYEEADTDDIARAAGIGKGTIYRHFASKQELFLALVDRGFELLRQRMGELARSREPFAEKIGRGLQLYIDFFIDNPQYYRVLMVEQPGHRLQFGTACGHGRQRFAQHLVKAISSGIKARELKPVNAEFAARSLMAIAGEILERNLRGERDTRKQDIKYATEIFLRGMQRVSVRG